MMCRKHNQGRESYTPVNLLSSDRKDNSYNIASSSNKPFEDRVKQGGAKHSVKTLYLGFLSYGI